MSSPPEPSYSGHDYTEGASPSDLEFVLSQTRKHTRRDSQVGSIYGDIGNDQRDSGAVFDGPGYVAVPSSVSSMHHERPISVRMGRLSMDGRRMSRDSQASRFGSLGDGAVQRSSSPDENALITDNEDQEEEPIRSRPRPFAGRRTSSSQPPQAGSVFGNIASFFGQTSTAKSPSRRTSFSRRSSAGSRRSSRRSGSRSGHVTEDEDYDSEEDRWGYASEEEEEQQSIYSISQHNHSDSDIGSFSSSRPVSPSGRLPGLPNNAVFGESRIEIGEFFEDDLPLPPPGRPSRQSVYLVDEDNTVRFVGFEVSPQRRTVWLLASICTFGGLALAGQWFPKLWLRWVAHEKAFVDIENGFVVLETSSKEILLFPIQELQYPYTLESVFPPSFENARASGTVTPSSSAKNVNSAHENGTSKSTPITTLKYIDYRYARFVLDPRSGVFGMLKDWRDPAWNAIANVRPGLVETVREQRSILFGPNVIEIEGKSITRLLIDEIIHPFYVFQIASIILWSLDDYYYYAFCIGLISAFSIGSTLLETRKTIRRMREMSRFSCSVGVLVDNKWEVRDSTSLIPGDIINLVDPQLTFVPADTMVLSGDAIVNESMLTGESVPVAKTPIKDEDLQRWRDVKDAAAESAKGVLYTGTRIIRIRKDGDRDAVGVVIRTGFNTTKGALVRSMLFPKAIGFKFYRDSMRFIAVLACIAGVGFLASAFQFVRLHIPAETILLRALDLITVVVPPALPATLSIGTSFAISRLRKAAIFCISPNRVNVAGKINVVCFDKTGTLTEDGLDILGVRALERTGEQFGELISDVHDLPLSNQKESFLYALATCHSLKIVDGEIIGDPLDVRMFDFTGWMLEEGTVGGAAIKKMKPGAERPAGLVLTVVRPPGSARFRVEDALKAGTKHAHFLELGVIRAFEFVSALRRMSVIVKRLKSSSMEIYVKGAPEVMPEICEKDSFPQDYDDLLSYYTKRGYRVIAIAGKSIEGLSWLKAQRLKREQAESGLRFLGLIIFENKIKPGTPPAIQTLRSAHLACRMVTGDNPQTAVSVARECGMINQAAHVFYPTFVQGGSRDPNARLQWTSLDDDTFKLDDYTLKPSTVPSNYNVENEEITSQDYALVLTGDVFRWMINHAPLETLHRMLVKAQIFARMSPDEKHELVERLQSLGYTVAFCGDGANDCGALKAADVGISLSEAEASVAAPFTSNIPDIGCVIQVIKEGRAALVTSFSCFKYMALYSLIQFTTITLLYSFASSLGDFQFLYIDLFIIIPIAVSMGRTLPFEKLHPKRPTANLVSKKVLASIIGQILITSVIQFWVFFWVRAQSWYTPPPDPDPVEDKLESLNFENTTLFLISSFQYILVAAVFSIGPPYRRPMWTNAPLMLSIIVLATFSTIVLLAPPQVAVLLLDIMPLPRDAKLALLGISALNVVASLAFERWLQGLFAKLLGFLSKLRGGSTRRRTNEGKMYKAVEHGLMRGSN
ncbi:hypothetical protein SISSUDRAFT_1044071 [Sistotremastrum suecicum HHB10207 ss-3]|uniref:Cation-transporting ATPase n=1 Tax=Sistotremastrum suecicum HHB10207 ss-3 TaxID=1314776 RepID=A0A166FDP0_9AGAM|nr:hypothetical protein SISSUDRAFT_1044071 [Sistotremastrum suecicum HHB10207 ss-3]